jgi:hypothetical protein
MKIHLAAVAFGSQRKLSKLEVPRNSHHWPTFGTDVLAESRFADNNRPIR